MFFSLVYIELVKYRRTIIPWMIGIAAFIVATTALLSVSTENSIVNWEAFAGRSLNIINLLALLLCAVFTGYVFVTEYLISTAGILFTYPVSRFKIYVVKNFVVLLFLLTLYLTFFFFILAFGLIKIVELPSMGFLLKFLKLIFMMTALNFVLVPVSAVFCIVIKGIGTYLLLGMSYVIAYICFISSNYCLFIPVCLPDKVVEKYFISEYLSKGDFIQIAIVGAITFISAFLIGAVCYSKSDVYK